MNDLGKHLRCCREKLNMSLRAVAEKTGVTDSRLSKIENGKLNCPATVLRSLSKIYGVSVISMFLIAGYRKRDDLQENQYVFQGVDKLDDEERKHIQEEIIFLVRKKESAL